MLTATDYKYRNLTSSKVACFISVDPKKEERAWMTPYNYVQNNPIVRIDPDGMLDDDFYFDSDGTLINHVKNDKPHKYYLINEDVTIPETQWREIKLNINQDVFEQVWERSDADSKNDEDIKEQLVVFTLDLEKAEINVIWDDDSNNKKYKSHSPKPKSNNWGDSFKITNAFFDKKKSILILLKLHSHPGNTRKPSEGDEINAWNVYFAPSYVVSKFELWKTFDGKTDRMYNKTNLIKNPLLILNNAILSKKK